MKPNDWLPGDIVQHRNKPHVYGYVLGFEERVETVLRGQTLRDNKVRWMTVFLARHYGRAKFPIYITYENCSNYKKIGRKSLSLFLAYQKTLSK